MSESGGTAQLEPAVIVIFGVTGDLAQRYLLPALYQLIKDNKLPAQTRILGISRRDVGTDQLLEGFEAGVENCEPAVLDIIRQRTVMFKMDLDDPASYDALLAQLNGLEEQAGMCLNRLYYLAIPPKAYNTVVTLLGDRGLNASCQHGQAASRLLVEKPFGHDLASAEKLVTETARHFGEEQIYRIDHYMAKPAVLDLLQARFANKDLERVWSAGHLAGLEIAAKETIGIEGRANFYDSLGALRDFVQSHLIQILGVVLMEEPAGFDSEHLHAAKAAALERIEPVPAGKVTERVVRGQYRDYREEVNNPGSDTETYAAVTVYSHDPRWQGMPIRLVTGKALNERITLIKGSLKEPLSSGKNELNWSSQGGNTYDRVLLDALGGDQTLFASSREILAGWRILQPVLDAWRQTNDDLIIYEPGSPGPKA